MNMLYPIEQHHKNSYRQFKKSSLQPHWKELVIRFFFHKHKFFKVFFWQVFLQTQNNWEGSFHIFCSLVFSDLTHYLVNIAPCSSIVLLKIGPKRIWTERTQYCWQKWTNCSWTGAKHNISKLNLLSGFFSYTSSTKITS